MSEVMEKDKKIDVEQEDMHVEMMKALYDLAAQKAKNAYAPYSEFKVGAAILTASGKVYTGVNVENSSYGATICAERVAFANAVAEGERDFVVIAVASGNEKPEEAIPCGICRQFMYEFSPEIYIVTGTDRENLNIRSLDKLLPMGFRLSADK